MKFRIVNITSTSKVKVKAPQSIVILPSNELIQLANDEVGFLEGKFTDHQRGIFMQGGIINPGWKGKISLELIVFTECQIEVGQQLAHAIILKGGE